MPFTESEIDRFARQVIIPGVGANGQERLCATRVRIVGQKEGVVQASRYARAAGLSVDDGTSRRPADYVLAASVEGNDTGALADPCSKEAPTVWYVIRGRQVVSGASPPGVAMPSVPAGDPEDPRALAALHAIAASDAVNTVIGLALGWADVEAHGEVRFA